MPNPLTYSFADVQASISGPGGAFSLGSGAGVAEEGITVAYINPKGSMDFGADGTPQNSLHASNGSRVTIRLLKTSPVNQQLAALYNSQAASSANWGQNTITVSNPVWGDSFNLQQCAFEKFPDVNYRVEAGMNEWVFLCGLTVPALGDGNPVSAG
jgi:hypothetical protein